jgi:hypothetical protein
VAEAVDPGPFLVGMNGKDGGKIVVRSGDDVRWWYHPTEAASVDIAVALFATPSIQEYALEWVSESIFATDERIHDYDIGIGDELTILGLFTRLSGSAHHIPIVRTGNIAMMPKDKIPVKNFGDANVYLAEGRSIGGLSGSPVFVRNTINLPPKKNHKGELTTLSGLGGFHLLGLLHGHWDLPVSFKDSEQMEAVNMGISIIFPAKQILEVLYHPELVDMRKQQDKKIRESNYATADSAFEKTSEQTKITKEDFDAALRKASRKIVPREEQK